MSDAKPHLSSGTKLPAPPGLVLALGILAASTSSILIRFAQQEADSLVIAAYRLILATLILLPFSLRRRLRDRQARPPFSMGLVLLSGFLLAVHFATWISSLEYTSITSSVVLVQMSPLFVTLLSPLLLGEKPASSTWIGLAVAFTGSVIIAVSDACSSASLSSCLRELGAMGPRALLGDVLALLGALSGAGYLLIGRRLRPSMDLLTYITWIYGTAAVCLLGAVILLGSPLTGYSRETYLWFLLLALFPQLLAHSSYNWALRHVTAAMVSISLLGEPVSASILGFVILNELPGWTRISGALFVLGGIILAVRKDKPRPANEPRDAGARRSV